MSEFLFVLWLVGCVTTYATLEFDTELDAIVLSFLWPLTWLWCVTRVLKGDLEWAHQQR